MGSRIAPSLDAFPLERGQRRPRRAALAHLAWIRTLPSLISGKRGCDACHVRYGSLAHGKRTTGGAEKPSDCWTVPLTRDEHTDQHRHNEREWWLKRGIDPLDIALRLWAASGDDEAGEVIVREARLHANR